MANVLFAVPVLMVLGDEDWVHNQYHGCWWPGDSRSKAISRHDVNYEACICSVFLEGGFQQSVTFQWLLTNDRNWEYIFLFSKKKSDWKELMSYFFREVKSKFLDLILGYSAHWSSSDLPSVSPDTVAVEATTKGQPHVSSAVTTPRPKLVTVATQTEGTGQSAGTTLIQNGRFFVGQISFFCLIFPWAKGPISQRHN